MNSESKRPRRSRLIVCAAVVGLVLLVTGGMAGYWLATRVGGTHSRAAADPPVSKAVEWTCSMHPQIRQPKPGQCPICFMDLIPLEDDSAGLTGPRQFRMSAAAMALAEIQTTPVRRQVVTKPVRMVGKVEYDETRLASIAAWVPGRLDRLYVDYTGVTVRQGDHLVYLYSPELRVAQQELLQMLDARDRATNETTRNLVGRNLQATEEKLRLLGLLDEQIEEIKQRGTTTDHLTIYAPIGGVVIERHASAGTYVDTGQPIYTIADLSQVWVLFDAYESDVPWLRYGQEVEFSTESHPGESFQGRIAFIDPMLNERTRSVRVRVNVPNPESKLKPNMFVRGVVRSRLSDAGRVFEPALAGKWISPMHPEIVKDGPGQCDICGMDLVPAEELGLVEAEATAEPPLVIPATAPLITGRRAVVYVRVPGTEEPVFEGREVVLGPRAGEFYVVRSGLEERERVVTNGAFKIDSALQIQAKPSMMSIEADRELVVPEAFREQLTALYDPYLRLQQALADDRLDEARTHWADLRGAPAVMAEAPIGERLDEAWQSIDRRLVTALDFDVRQADIGAIRERFEDVALAMLQVVETFGHSLETSAYEAYCPMAFDDRGASWLQAGTQIDNPYFGHAMRRCGEIRREFAASVARSDQPPAAAASPQE
jgi:membrane fusion protein, copper/silver efflux system